MAANTEISWTDATFNPVWGCIKVSPGCENCYAMTWANRYGFDVWGPAKTTGRRTFGDKHWAEPLKWNRDAEKQGRRIRVFCSSMADIFEDHPVYDTERPKLWALIEATPNLDWLLLTKRPQNIRAMTPLSWQAHPRKNAWYGTSVEDQQRADERIIELMKVNAWVRFLSCEPLLSHIHLPTIAQPWKDWRRCGGPGIHWVIGGGESGSGARPCWPSWAYSLRDQCKEMGMAFHWKQWGEYEPYEESGQAPFWHDQHGRMHDGHALDVLNPETSEVNSGWHEDSIHSPYIFRRVGKKAAGRLLDGRTWDEFPVPAPDAGAQEQAR